MDSKIDQLSEKIEQTDIVVMHWWNHPLLYALLVRESLPSARIIFWSHISGFSAPYVFNEPALCYPDLFVFTSPLSLNVPEVRSLPDNRQKALRVIWSTGGIEHTASVRPNPHSGFNIGYIGTVDYGKLHPHFLKMSSDAKIPDVRFIVCGGHSAFAASLSGGNLQKYIVGRETMLEPKVMVVSQPTWGVDVGASMLIRQALIDLRDAGVAVLVVSEELDELFEICDRIAVIAQGRLSEARPRADTHAGEIGLLMSGSFVAGGAHSERHFSPAGALGLD